MLEFDSEETLIRDRFHFAGVGRRPSQRLTFLAVPFPRFLPRDCRRLCSLQLIAVRPNGSPIRVNTVAIMSRLRVSPSKARSKKKRLFPSCSLCAYMCPPTSLFLTIGIVWYPPSPSSVSILIHRCLLSASFFSFLSLYLNTS